MSELPKPASHEISLSQATGRDIHDVYGYMTREFGDPVFHVTRIMFADHTYLCLDAEHDIAYIADPPIGVAWPDCGGDDA